MRLTVFAFATWIGVGCIIVHSSDVSAQQQQQCISAAQCAQQAVDAAARIEAAVKALEQKLATNFVVSGNRVRCDISWKDPPTEENTSFALCPPTSTLLSGGCDMTCLSMDHLSSIPSPPGPNAKGWQCRHAPQPGPMLDADKRDNRSFSALALCQTR
jgi:hypothetical protein